MALTHASRDPDEMPTFVLWHEHTADECRHAFAAWQGFDSPLRHRDGLGACLFGDHVLFWAIEAATATDARSLLPDYVAARTHVREVRRVRIP
jgi:hypothetical protein